MGSLFRSQEMTLCQLFIQSEATYSCVSELGELGLVQFRDLNQNLNSFQRKFVNEIRRCDEMERKLRFLEKEITKSTIPIREPDENPEAPQPREMIDLEATLEKLETELREVNSNSEALKKNFLELTELKHILRKTVQFFDEPHELPVTTNPRSTATASYGGDRSERVNLLSAADDDDYRPGPGSGSVLRFGFVAGVIHRERLPAFERMMWRACRGNVYLRRSEIEGQLEDPATGEPVHKAVFVVFYQGEQLKTRVSKICEAFRAGVYPCPDAPAERREMALGVMTRLEDLDTVLRQTEDHRRRVLQAAAQNLRLWFIRIGKIKAIYVTLNMFNIDVTQKCMIAEAWCPVDDLDKIQLALRRGTERSGAGVQSILNRVPTAEQPPTYNKLNKFTQCFQNLVDAYGSGAYREVNPAPFAIITFPFLFGVMFGDLGHGILMLSFALWMVLKERSLAAAKSTNEIWTTVFSGRYIILLMGMFSMYTGFLYNDIFSKSMNIFGTSWFYPVGYPMPVDGQVQMDPANSSQFTGAAYPFGLDPMWQLSENKITFTNSVKMKMSIILGVIQMTVGIVLGLYNHVFFRKPLNIFFEWIPQILFLECIFGYMMILIFVKWIAFPPSSSNTAPSLLIGMINMFMFRYDENQPVAYQPWYDGQQAVQTCLLLIAVLCVPVMLIVKPVILIRRMKLDFSFLGAAFGPPKLSVNSGDLVNAAHPPPAVDSEGNYIPGELSYDSATATTVDMSHGSSQLISDSQPSQHTIESRIDFRESQHEEPPGDIIVHQAIHTIEFCLSCISNTASYLRLWALSLAHAQLSEVLWEMVMHIGLSINSPLGSIMIYLVFIPFSVLTVGILLIMEGLSAFLHALRLHWVEFMSKFYAGTGYPFVPFSFAAVLETRRSD